MSCFDGQLGYLIFVVASHFTTKIPEIFQRSRFYNPILHWLLLLDRPRPQQWYITYTELITLSTTLYNAETSIFAKKYTTYGPQNRAVNEEQRYKGVPANHGQNSTENVAATAHPHRDYPQRTKLAKPKVQSNL